MRKFVLGLSVLMICSVLLLAGCDGSDKLTLEQYDKIENGMTYAAVIDIIGFEGTLSAETGEKGTEFYTVIYTYEGSGSLGANALFTFQGEPLTLQSKAQTGLR